MSLTVAVQMDPIQRIRIAGDSTFALLLEAQARGHRVLYYVPDDLSMRDGHVVARVQPIEVRDVEGDHFTLGESTRMDLSEADVVLMRQEPPFDMAYVTATHMLERIHPKTLVVNDPAEVRNAPEKLFVTYFPQLMPPTLITRDKAEIEAFRAEFGDIVMKPLHGHGGAAVVRIGREDMNFGSLFDLFSTIFREQWVVQRFLPEVSEGDKRIVLIDGKVTGAINRIPGAGEIRSNLAVGGSAAKTELTATEREICAALGPELKARGLLFVGIDVIGGKWLTEINVTSPTGIVAIDRFNGTDTPALIWDAIEAKLG